MSEHEHTWMRVVSRRDFMKIVPAAAAGLAVGVYLDGSGTLLADSNSFAPNAFVAIDVKDDVFIWTARSEMGQGVRTALPAIVADELGADWKRVKIVPAAFDPKYGDQSTGGSMSVRTCWERLRQAGATAREMLIEAFCQQNKFDRKDCVAENGYVKHVPSGKQASFGQLATAAAALPVPKDVQLKGSKDFKLIGKSLPRVDSPEKLTGAAKFGIDVRVPGMMFATVARCPIHGGKVASFDSAEALKIAGVKHVFEISRGVAVVAENTWAAIKGREALEITWNDGGHANDSSETLREQFKTLTSTPQKAFYKDGDANGALAGGGRKAEAVYELPFIAHAPLEPPNCIAWVQKDQCEIWAPTQIPGWPFGVARRITGLSPDKIKINIPLLGGGFGRKAFPGEIEEAVQISKKLEVPVQVVWTRDDDLQHDYFRPASYHVIKGALAQDGKPSGWLHRFSSTPIQTALDPQTKEPEALELGGATDIPYLIPNVSVEYAPAVSPLPRGWLRSVEHTFNAFVVEAFVDELAAAAGRDPLEYRLELLLPSRTVKSGETTFETGRLANVLRLAADKAGWAKRKLGPGRGMGLACHFSFYSYVAEVAEVGVDKNGTIKVERLACAVDCGRVINPDGVRQQVEGGIIYALSAALKHEITVKDGRVEQSNWNNFEILRLGEAPRIDVHLVRSEAPPTGIGEPAFPPVAPAVANAVFAATGKRVRKLPIRL
jgi:isoquinoline 1-oxidoreductase beta subunit